MTKGEIDQDEGKGNARAKYSRRVQFSTSRCEEGLFVCREK